MVRSHGAEVERATQRYGLSGTGELHTEPPAGVEGGFDVQGPTIAFDGHLYPIVGRTDQRWPDLFRLRDRLACDSRDAIVLAQPRAVCRTPGHDAIQDRAGHGGAGQPQPEAVHDCAKRVNPDRPAERHRNPCPGSRTVEPRGTRFAEWWHAFAHPKQPTS